MEEILSELIDNKKQYITNPKNKNFLNQIKILFGKTFQENEIENLIKLNEKEFSDKIKNKFNEKKQERIDFLGENEAKEIEKRIFLQLIDQNWKMHIQYLEQLRQVIGLRSYGQRDPLVDYKKEAFNLFENLLKKLKSDLITILLNLKIVEQKTKEAKTNQFNKKDLERLANKKIGRNEPCPCKSGKKYKHCCGAL